MEPQQSRKRQKLSNGQMVEVSIVAYQVSPERGEFRILHDCRKEVGDKRYVPMERAEEAFKKWCASEMPMFGSVERCQFDAKIVAPSEKQFASILADHADIHARVDLSGRFSKRGGFHSGEGCFALCDVHDAIQYAAAGDEGGISSLAIFDDVVSDEGKTVAALIQRLREAGLSEDVNVTVFCAHYCSGRTMKEDILEIMGR